MSLITKGASRASTGIMPEVWSYAKAVADKHAGPAAKLTAHGMSCEVEIVLVTPELAREYLNRNAKNRRPRPSNVKFLAEQMKAGSWVFNGEPIIFDKDDLMIDGQHRCAAGIESGKPFLSLVVRKVDRDCFDRIDLGAKRTAGDILGIEGIQNGTFAAAATLCLLNWRQGNSWWEKKQHVSPHEIASAYNSFPGLQHAINVGRNTSAALYGTPTFWIAAYYVLHDKDPETADKFFERITYGVELKANDPELVLRHKLTGMALRRDTEGVTSKALAAMVHSAWNARRRGRPLQIIRGLVNGEVPPII